MAELGFIVGAPCPAPLESARGTTPIPGLRLPRHLSTGPWRRTIVRVDGGMPDLGTSAPGTPFLAALGADVMFRSRTSSDQPYCLYMDEEGAQAVMGRGLHLDHGRKGEPPRFRGTALLVRVSPGGPRSMTWGAGRRAGRPAGGTSLWARRRGQGAATLRHPQPHRVLLLRAGARPRRRRGERGHRPGGLRP